MAYATDHDRWIAALMTGTRLVAVGHFQPERVVPNSELETMVETSDEWIQRRVGIKERRWAAPEETVDVMAEKAALDTLAKGGMSADQVDLVIVATCSALDRSPNMAARVAARLGIPASPGHHRRQHRLLGLSARRRARPARDRRGRLHHGTGDRLREAHRRHRLHRPDHLRADRGRRRGVPAHRRSGASTSRRCCGAVCPSSATPSGSRRSTAASSPRTAARSTAGRRSSCRGSPAR